MNAQELALECMKFEGSARRIAQLELRKGGPAYALPEDMVQDALVKVLESPESYDPEQGTVKNWFLQIVVNCCHDVKKKDRGRGEQKRRFVSLEKADKIAVPFEPPDPLILDALSPRQRQVMELRLEGYSYEEIGDRLGLSGRTVDGHVQRARRKLRQAKRERLEVF